MLTGCHFNAIYSLQISVRKYVIFARHKYAPDHIDPIEATY